MVLTMRVRVVAVVRVQVVWSDAYSQGGGARRPRLFQCFVVLAGAAVMAVPLYGGGLSRRDDRHVPPDIRRACERSCTAWYP